MKFNPKYNIGEKVFVAFRHQDVTFNDRLPILQMEIKSIELRAKFYGESNTENSAEITYELDGLNDFSHAYEKEKDIFKTKEEAEKRALPLLKEALKRVNKTTVNIQNMIASSDVKPN